MSAREAGKAARRKKILAAAEALIRRDGDIRFGMRELAKKAKVSPATPFNLFGSKGDILWALLEQDRDLQFQKILEDEERDPIERVLGLAERAVLAYGNDEAFSRPVLSAVITTVEMPGLLGVFTDVWRKALEEVEAKRLLIADLDPDLLARQLHLEYRAGLTMWLRHEVDVEGWRLHMQQSVLLVLRGSMQPRAAKALLPRLIAVQRKLRALS